MDEEAEQTACPNKLGGQINGEDRQLITEKLQLTPSPSDSQLTTGGLCDSQLGNVTAAHIPAPAPVSAAHVPTPAPVSSRVPSPAPAPAPFTAAPVPAPAPAQAQASVPAPALAPAVISHLTVSQQHPEGKLIRNKSSFVYLWVNLYNTGWTIQYKGRERVKTKRNCNYNCHYNI